MLSIYYTSLFHVIRSMLHNIYYQMKLTVAVNKVRVATISLHINRAIYLATLLSSATGESSAKVRSSRESCMKWEKDKIRSVVKIFIVLIYDRIS